MVKKMSAFYRPGFIAGFTFADPLCCNWSAVQLPERARLLRSFGLVTLNTGEGCCNVTELLVRASLQARNYLPSLGLARRSGVRRRCDRCEFFSALNCFIM